MIKQLNGFLIGLGLLTASRLSAQSDVGLTLEQCLQAARQNQPAVGQLAIISDITSRQWKQAGATYLPTFQVNGQASYQSEVTQVPLRLPGIEIPTLSKDQYRLVGEVQQVLWDGGVSAGSKNLSLTAGDLQTNGVENLLFQTQQPVIQAFFALLINRKQQELNRIAQEQINQRLRQAGEALQGGIIIKSDWRLLRLKSLDLEAMAQQLREEENSLTAILQQLTGLTVDRKSLVTPMTVQTASQKWEQRPDLQGLQLQRQQLVQQSDLVRARNNPRFSAFGQAGYGRPGLNMLEDKFATFGIFGLRAQWNLSPYYNGTQKRDLEILQLQQKNLDLQKETLLQNLELQTIQQQKLITNTLTAIAALELKMPLLHENTLAADLQWKQGVITTADYLDRWTDEQVAQQNLDLQKILITKYQTEYLWLTGNLGL